MNVSERKTIYEIFRACRLCGAGHGFKLPIIQNVLTKSGVDLKDKIWECVKIEVDAEDKMPPLICEPCTLKIDEFYEYLILCKQTNRRTRLRLGLPLAPSNGGADDEKDDEICSLSETEPLSAKETWAEEPLQNSMVTKQLLVKIEKQPLVLLTSHQGLRTATAPTTSAAVPARDRPKAAPSSKSLVSLPPADREVKERGRSSKPVPRKPRDSSAPPASRVTRQTREDDKPIKESPRPLSKKRRLEADDKPSRAKKMKQATPAPAEPSPPPPPSPPPAPKLTPAAKVPPAAKATPASKLPPTQKVPPASKLPPAPKVPPAPKLPPAPKPPPPMECRVCHVQMKNPTALSNHLRSHHVTFTNQKLACNACAEWFNSLDEANAHHKAHRAAVAPYRCDHCGDSFTTYVGFNEHHVGNACDRYMEFPDVQCSDCQRMFPTWTLRDRHRCPGADGRPGGKCSKCRRSYALLKNLLKHESTCVAKRRGQLIIAPEVMSEIRPAQIVTERCDALIARSHGPYVDVSDISPKFGLDLSRDYPYFNSTLRVQANPDGMVNITEDLLSGSLHWSDESCTDAPDDTASIDSANVETLATLCLHTVNKFLGAFPKLRSLETVNQFLEESPKLHGLETECRMSNFLGEFSKAPELENSPKKDFKTETEFESDMHAEREMEFIKDNVVYKQDMESDEELDIGVLSVSLPKCLVNGEVKSNQSHSMENILKYNSENSNSFNEAEVDDKQLMDALDAQIGETGQLSNGNTTALNNTTETKPIPTELDHVSVGDINSEST